MGIIEQLKQRPLSRGLGVLVGAFAAFVEIRSKVPGM